MKSAIVRSSCASKPAARLRIRLLEPDRGAIPANWDGALKLDIHTEVDPSTESDGWYLRLTIYSDTSQIAYPETSTTVSTGESPFQLGPSELERLREVMSTKKSAVWSIHFTHWVDFGWSKQFSVVWSIFVTFTILFLIVGNGDWASILLVCGCSECHTWSPQ